MFQTKVVDKIKIHILWPVTFFFSENSAVYEIMWKNIIVPSRPQMKIWRMRFACWIRNATDSHPEYVTLIAFPLQQWLHERVWMLRHTYSTLPVLSYSLKFVPCVSWEPFRFLRTRGVDYCKCFSLACLVSSSSSCKNHKRLYIPQ